MYMDISDMTDQQAEDAATRALWNALPKVAQAAIAEEMTAEQRAEVRKAIGRAKNLPKD